MLYIISRHPASNERPEFSEITQHLSFPDPKLLKWSDEDRSVHPEATKLGADLLCAQELFKDLQTRYIYKQSNFYCIAPPPL